MICVWTRLHDSLLPLDFLGVCLEANTTWSNFYVGQSFTFEREESLNYTLRFTTLLSVKPAEPLCLESCWTPPAFFFLLFLFSFFLKTQTERSCRGLQASATIEQRARFKSGNVFFYIRQKTRQTKCFICLLIIFFLIQWCNLWVNICWAGCHLAAATHPVNSCWRAGLHSVLCYEVMSNSVPNKGHKTGLNTHTHTRRLIDVHGISLNQCHWCYGK